MPKGVYQRSPKHIAKLTAQIKTAYKFRVYRPRTAEEKLAISIGTQKAVAGKPGWNLGLTKETDSRVAKYAQSSRGKVISLEQREQLSKWNKEHPSRYWLGKHRSEETKRKLRLARARQKPMIKETIPERLVAQELTRRGINFIPQHPLLDGMTIADFYLPDYNIVLYADGNYWHNLPNYIERDKRINKALKANGYKVLRFWEKDIKANVRLLLYSALK